MHSRLNLVKPISRYERLIGEKCGRIKKDEVVPMYENIYDGLKFPRKPILQDNSIRVGTKLSQNNIEILEHILGNQKLSLDKFVRSNLTEILKMASDKEGVKLLKTILTPETLDKIETQRRLVRNYPRNYVKDKNNVKYLDSPAGLSMLFHDINILKAAYIMEPKSLDSLFKLDITSEVGRDFLEFIGKMNLEEMTRFKNNWRGADII